MNLEYNFDNVVLLRTEIRSLRKIKSKSVNQNAVEHFKTLYHADLIKYDYGDQQDEFGQFIRLETVHVTDKGTRYLVWLRRQRMKSILLPVSLSVLTTAVIYILEHSLLPKLLSLFS